MTESSMAGSTAPSAATQTRDWIVGVIDTPADAEQAAQELRNAGFADDEVRLSHGPEAEQSAQDQAAHQGFFKRILSELVGDTNEKGSFADDYSAEARMGHSIISVYAPQTEDIAQAQQILEAHGAHRIKHYGRWTVNQLSMQPRDMQEPQAAEGAQAAANANQQMTMTQMGMVSDPQAQRGMAGDQQMAPSSPGGGGVSAAPNTTGAQTGMAEPSSTQAHMTSQPNTTNATNPQTNMPNTVESASGWQPMPSGGVPDSGDEQSQGEGI